MAGIRSKSKLVEQNMDQLGSHSRSRKLHKRKSNKAMEGIIMKITETSISEIEKDTQKTKALSASDTEGAFILPTSSARRHRRKKIKSMETQMNDLNLGSTNPKTPNRSEENNRRCRKEIASRNERESSISLSENSDGDTGGEGDDEMTDCCSGPDSTIPEVIKWWENDSDKTVDEFQTIMRGALPYMSNDSQGIIVKHQEKGFRSRLGRLSGFRSQRRGRRRAKSNHHHHHNNAATTSSHGSSRNFNHGDVTTTRESRNFYKRRKAGNDEDVYMSNNEIPIPSSNIGYQMLTDMGWMPGQGLTKRGIRDPVMPKGRRKRSAGLGF